jgi:hypothetical protein
MASLGAAAAAAAAVAALAAVLSVSRAFTPHAAYTVDRVVPGAGGAAPFELRRYAAHHVAETEIDAGDANPSLRAAGGAGFRHLARYIFGGTADGSKIAMTTPVALAPDAAHAGRVAVRFFLPAALAAPPAPLDARVRVRAVPAALVAARALPRAAESLDAGALAAAAAALAADAAAAGLRVVDNSAAQLAYDPPWTPFFLRRNEVVVGIHEAA